MIKIRLQITLVFKCPTSPNSSTAETIGRELIEHGDFAKDVAFRVDDLNAFLKAGIHCTVAEDIGKEKKRG